MSTNSQRVISFTFTGDRAYTPPQVSGALTANSPAAESAPITLAPGDNTITVPTGGTVPTAVTIQKPSTNTATIKLKGAGGDTGVKLHATEPDSISLDATQTTIILNASSTVTGIVLVWS